VIAQSPEKIGVYLELTSVVLVAAVVLWHFLKGHRNGTSADPITILARAAGFAILPYALVIIYGAFDPTVLCTVPGLRVFVMVGGLSLVYVCFKSLTS